jgi:hypothetical protein
MVLCRAQTITQMLLMVVSFPIMFFLVVKCVPDTNYFTETMVIPPTHIIAKGIEAQPE